MKRFSLTVGGVGNTPSEPGQPAPPKLDGKHCPVCGKELVETKRVLGGIYQIYQLECPDRCALVADEP